MVATAEPAWRVYLFLLLGRLFCFTGAAAIGCAVPHIFSTSHLTVLLQNLCKLVAALFPDNMLLVPAPSVAQLASLDLDDVLQWPRDRSCSLVLLHPRAVLFLQKWFPSALLFACAGSRTVNGRGYSNRAPPSYESASSMMSSDLESTSFFDSEDESSRYVPKTMHSPLKFMYTDPNFVTY